MKQVFKEIQQKLQDGNHMPEMNYDKVEEHVCLNCGTKFHGNFCPQCKQKATTARLTLKDTFRNFTDRFTHVDKGLLHTIIDLLIRPGYMVRDYLNGHRAEYIDPLMLLIIILAISFFLPDYSNETEDFLGAPYPEKWATLLAGHSLSLKVTHFWHWILFTDMQRICIFLCVISSPAIPWTLKIVRAKEKALNISESLHLMLYAICYMIIFDLIFTLIMKCLPASCAPIYEQGEDLILWLFVIVGFIMVRTCTSISWKKMLLFILVFPIMFMVCWLIVFGIIEIIIMIDTSTEVAKQINLTDIMQQ